MADPVFFRGLHFRESLLGCFFLKDRIITKATLSPPMRQNQALYAAGSGNDFVWLVEQGHGAKSGGPLG